MSKKVIVYTQPSCPPCKIVKQFLDHHNVEYIEKDISVDNNARNTLINELSSTSTPTITVDEHVITGFDLQRLENLLGI
ncbi:glutaredoxin family protein [Metabacillus malikii]|uniref:Glutaredoxin-like YruB-family protein n=1 Tax=Metabacillus malikii TaxID=1504265 RepID=A0ABT9ZC82_9BACI|nr:glutaredoxin domain-containing protein [Metabacillus malikii]MDQ0229534.1 glutaredoxin-like YruB-family protein [Metabacillus malikii]